MTLFRVVLVNVHRMQVNANHPGGTRRVGDDVDFGATGSRSEFDVPGEELQTPIHAARWLIRLVLRSRITSVNVSAVTTGVFNATPTSKIVMSSNMV